ncbi:MAG: universal stress protein [Deltaproteobacteria bacterium]|nr:universal stress protein [Deltaproteobacteria bacterium]
MLVPTDFSAGAAFAAKRALLLPLSEHARVTFLHILPSNLPIDLRPEAERKAKSNLDKAVSDARSGLKGKSRPTIDCAIAWGKPADEIVHRATALKADLVVIGRHGRRAVRDLFVGSTASLVMRESDVPVLLVNLQPSAISSTLTRRSLPRSKGRSILALPSSRSSMPSTCLSRVSCLADQSERASSCATNTKPRRERPWARWSLA